MGTWGSAIFADDDAEDLRDEYRYILAGAQAVIRYWQDRLSGTA